MVRQMYPSVSLTYDETVFTVTVSTYSNLGMVELNVEIYDEEGFDKSFTIAGNPQEISDLATVLQYAVHMLYKKP